MFEFTQIRIAPFTELMGVPVGQSHHRGGPLWPNWEQQTVVRQRWADKFIDTEPRWHEDAPTELLSGITAAWGGPVVQHFGHMIADFSMRIAIYAQIQSEFDYIIFGLSPKIQKPPQFFLELLQWYGIDSSKVKYINKQMVVDRLLVAPQQEWLPDSTPSTAYLDILNKNTLRNWPHLATGDTSSPTSAHKSIDTIFVSRAGVRSKIAGELYLETAFQEAGVRIMRPERMSLPEQLNIYQQAKRLIFSEGSALHGLQLLGTGLGTVHVLNRRPGWKISQQSLQPRCEALHYHNVSKVVCGLNAVGKPAKALGMSILNEAAFKKALSILKIETPKWSTENLKKAAQLDINQWLAEQHKKPRHAYSEQSFEQIKRQLSELSFNN